MYHFGEGVSSDYYMALRHYNLAIERNGSAYYPVKAMLWLLDYPDIAYWIVSTLCVVLTSMLLIFKKLV